MKIILLTIGKLLLELVSFSVVLLAMIWFYYELGFEKVAIVALAYIVSVQLWDSKWLNKI